MTTQAILKAIDAEHRDNCRAAQAIYDEQMKPFRDALAKAKADLETAKTGMALAERRFATEHQDNVTESDRRRTELRRVVAGTQPAKIASIAKVSVTPRSGRPVSLPRLKCLEAPAP